jgi:hypothetical protein
MSPFLVQQALGKHSVMSPSEIQLDVLLHLNKLDYSLIEGIPLRGTYIEGFFKLLGSATPLDNILAELLSVTAAFSAQEWSSIKDDLLKEGTKCLDFDALSEGMRNTVNSHRRDLGIPDLGCLYRCSGDCGGSNRSVAATQTPQAQQVIPILSLRRCYFRI